MWPEAVLSQLDSLWAVQTRIGIVQNRLQPLLGWFPSADDVREAANRRADVPNNGKGATFIHIDPIRLTLAPRPKDDNRVRLVAPGTFPNRGFTMLRPGRKD
jgi:hypothetical protein